MKKVYLALAVLLIIFGIGVFYLYSQHSKSFATPSSVDDVAQ